MEALASVDDLATFGVSADTALMAAALDAASAAVRDAAGVPISRAVSDLVIPVVSCGQWLDLGVAPVVSVAGVELNGVPVTDWSLVNGVLWRAGGWGSLPDVVAVTVTHGYDPVPADIVLLVCELAGAVVAAAGEGGGVETRLGVQSERIDDYSVSFETGQGGSASLLDLPERARAALRRRFGGGAFVTGSR